MRWRPSTLMRRIALQSPGLRNTRWTKLKLGWWTFCIWSVFVCISRMIDKFVLYRRFTSTTQQRWQKRSQPWWNCRTGSFVGLWLAWGLRFSWLISWFCRNFDFLQGEEETARWTEPTLKKLLDRCSVKVLIQYQNYIMLETTSYSRYSGQRDTFPAGPQSPYLQPPKKHSIFDAFNTAAM